METPPPPNRMLAIVLGAVATACLLFAAFTHGWLQNSSEREPLRYGLTSVMSCSEASGTRVCDDEPLGEHVERLSILRSTQHASLDAFLPSAWVTLAMCLLAAAGLTTAAGLALARRRPALPIAPTTIALIATLLAVVAGCVFVMTQPALIDLGPGFSFYVFAAGCLLGLYACNRLARVNRPADPDLLADAMDPDEF
jgi:hypothetical protein